MEDFTTFPREYWLLYGSNIHAGQRHGQATFNAVSTLWPDVTNSLVGSSYDPFYNDSRTDAFLDIVLERLTAPNRN